MKFTIMLSLLLGCFFLSSCGTAKVVVKNCENISKNIYECEEIK